MGSRRAQGLALRTAGGAETLVIEVQSILPKRPSLRRVDLTQKLRLPSMHLVWPFGHLRQYYMQFGAIKNREPPCLARLISPVFLFAVVGEERRRAKPIPYSHGHGNLNMAKKGPIFVIAH